MGGRYGASDDGSSATADRRPAIELRRDAHQTVIDTFQQVEQDRERRELDARLDDASDGIEFIFGDAHTEVATEDATDSTTDDTPEQSGDTTADSISSGLGSGGSPAGPGDAATTDTAPSDDGSPTSRVDDIEDGEEPQAWHKAFSSREGIGGMLEDMPTSEAGDSADSQEALDNSYTQLFDRMDEMSAAATDAAEAQGEALRSSHQQREAAKSYDNDDIQRDKTGVPGRERGQRNAEEQRIQRGTDVAGPHSVPWNEQQTGEQKSGDPQNKTLSQQESIEGDAAELNRISAEAHNGIDHGERAEAVRTTSPTQTAPTDDVLNPFSTTQDIDEPAYSPEGADIASAAESIPEDWETTLTDNHSSEIAEQVDDLAEQITGAFPESASDSNVTLDQFTTGPDKATVATRIADLVENSGYDPEEAAFEVADELNGDSRTRHAFDSSQFDAYEMLSDSRQEQATAAAENLQDTYPSFDQQPLEAVERQVAREMADSTDTLTAAESAVQNAAANDTFQWPIERLDVNAQHRVTVEGEVTTLYDPNSASQHQVGIIESPDADHRTVDNHMKFTWHKSSGTTGKVSDLSGEASAAGNRHTPTVDDSAIDDSREMIREGDRIRIVRGTVDEWEEAAQSGEDGQKQIAVRGVTSIQIIEPGDGAVIYEEMDQPVAESTPQDLDAATASRDNDVDPDDYETIDEYLAASEPDPEEQRPAAADATTAARDVVDASDPPADREGLSVSEAVDRDVSSYEATTDQQGGVPSNPWKANAERERTKDARRNQRYEEFDEASRRSRMQRWDMPDEAIDEAIDEAYQQRVDEEVEQSMSYHRSQSETEFGYDSQQVHLDLPTESERRE